MKAVRKYSQLERWLQRLWNKAAKGGRERQRDLGAIRKMFELNETRSLVKLEALTSGQAGYLDYVDSPENPVLIWQTPTTAALDVDDVPVLADFLESAEDDLAMYAMGQIYKEFDEAFVERQVRQAVRGLVAKLRWIR